MSLFFSVFVLFLPFILLYVLNSWPYASENIIALASTIQGALAKVPGALYPALRDSQGRFLCLSCSSQTWSQGGKHVIARVLGQLFKHRALLLSKPNAGKTLYLVRVASFCLFPGASCIHSTGLSRYRSYHQSQIADPFN